MSKYTCPTCNQPTITDQGHISNPWACITALKRDEGKKAAERDALIDALLWVIDALQARLLIVGHRRDKWREKLAGANECWPKVVEFWKKRALKAEEQVEWQHVNGNLPNNQDKIEFYAKGQRCVGIYKISSYGNGVFINKQPRVYTGQYEQSAFRVNEVTHWRLLCEIVTNKEQGQ